MEQKRVYLCMPRKYWTAFSEQYELDHGLVIKGLNPYINEGYLQAYFREWGTITACTIKKSTDGKSQALGFVRFSSEDEANKADWAGPHFVAGTEAEVKRVVCLKMDEPGDNIEVVPLCARPRPSLGLGYILEDAQWLDEEDEGK